MSRFCSSNFHFDLHRRPLPCFVYSSSPAAEQKPDFHSRSVPEVAGLACFRTQVFFNAGLFSPFQASVVALINSNHGFVPPCNRAALLDPKAGCILQSSGPGGRTTSTFSCHLTPRSNCEVDIDVIVFIRMFSRRMMLVYSAAVLRIWHTHSVIK